MSNASQQIVNNAWNFAHLLRMHKCGRAKA
jgi:hypothetical protein